MKLILREIDVYGLELCNEKNSAGVKDGILYVNKNALVEHLKQDSRVAEVTVAFARPGESKRIIPVKDVIEPRTKIGEGKVFPGFDGAPEQAGIGTTLCLKNCAVVTTGPIVGFQEGIIDMSGPLVAYTPFAKLCNIVVGVTPVEGIGKHEHEEVLRLAGLRAARFLAGTAAEAECDREKHCEWDSFAEKAGEHPGLPKIVYVDLCVSQGLLHDTYFYGKNMQKSLPTVISPLELVDGVLVSGNCVSPGSKTTTYHHQNNAVISECMNRHGKEINFYGMVISPLMTTLQDKYMNSMLTGNIVAMMGADGAVISQEGFGNPTSDLMMICKQLEDRGIKTVLISNEDAGVDGFSESLPDGTPEADAIVSTGNSNARIELPPMEEVLGDLKTIERLTGGFVGSILPDNGLVIEIHGIMGSHNLQGYSNLSAITI